MWFSEDTSQTSYFPQRKGIDFRKFSRQWKLFSCEGHMKTRRRKWWLNDLHFGIAKDIYTCGGQFSSHVTFRRLFKGRGVNALGAKRDHSLQNVSRGRGYFVVWGVALISVRNYSHVCILISANGLQWLRGKDTKLWIFTLYLGVKFISHEYQI